MTIDLNRIISEFCQNFQVIIFKSDLKLIKGFPVRSVATYSQLLSILLTQVANYTWKFQNLRPVSRSRPKLTCILSIVSLQ